MNCICSQLKCCFNNFIHFQIGFGRWRRTQQDGLICRPHMQGIAIGRQIEILDLIKSLCHFNDFTVVIALHDLNLATQYCDRLILMNRGKIHCQGCPDEVITADNIAQVYGSGSHVYQHPLSGLPVVLPLAGKNQIRAE